MEKKVLYKTKFGKPIVEGQKYSVVTKDNRVIQTVASSRTPEDESIVERFLTKTGADKFVKAQLAKPGPARNAKQATEAQLTKLNVLEQLEYVDGKEEFTNWLKRNNLRVASSTAGLAIYQGSLTFIGFTWGYRGMACCGAREMCSHSGSISVDASKGLNENRLKILASYIVEDFRSALKKEVKNYGIVTYVRNPDSIADVSARIGYLLAASDFFVKTGRFVNPNSKNTLDVYAISDKWYNS